MSIKAFFGKHSGTILTVTACVGAAATAYFGYSGGIKARRLLEDKWYMENDPMEPMPSDLFKYYGTKETIKATWKAWGPAVGSCAVTITSIIGLRCADAKMINNISAVANVAKLTNETFVKNVEERIGKEKTKEIIDETSAEVVKKTVDPNKVNKISTKFNSSNGQTYILAYDPNIVFKMEPEKLQAEINDLNAQLVAGMGPDVQESKCGAYIPYNSFLERVGAEMITDGWDKGWPCIEYAKGPMIIEPMYTAGNFDNGASYSVLSFNNGPFYLDDPIVWKYFC